MGSEWKQTTVGDFLESFGGEIQTGPFGTKLKAAQYSTTGVPLISVGEVQLGELVLHDRTPRVSSDITRKMPEYVLREGDIVFGRKGAVERSARVKKAQDGWFLGSDGIRLRLPPICDTRFVAYQFLSEAHKQWMVQHAAGTTMASLNEKIIRLIPIVLPPLAEQKRIADILNSLDDKIELNRKMNETLEAMAQALFKSWFVDFDPVIDNALKAGKPVPEELAQKAAARKALGKDRKGLPEEIQRLFPDEFVESGEMGWVPLGWGVGRIADVCTLIQNGGTPNRSISDYWDNGTIPWLVSGEVRQAIIVETSNWITEKGLKNSSAKWIPSGTTVVALYGATAGQVAFVSAWMTTNQAVCGLTPKSNFTYFNYLLLSRSASLLANQARGSAQQNLSKGIVEETKIIIPSNAIASIFEKECEDLFSKWITNIKSANALSMIRDTLLPKLLSGEIILEKEGGGCS